MSIIFNFTVEERNLIAIYRLDTKAATIELITDALPFMDEDMRTIAEQSAATLAELTDMEFLALSFALDDEDEDEGGEYAETIEKGAY